MPNLFSRAHFDFDFGNIAIVSGNDDRIQQIKRNDSATSALLSGFEYSLGSKTPAALVYRNPEKFSNLRDAMVDARNCVAVACSCFGWVQSIGHVNNFSVRDTDHFDFYPRQPSSNGTSLKYRGPALDWCSKPDGFRGMTHPYLPVTFDIQPVHDEDLLRKLTAAWRRIHVMQRPTNRDRRLLRALSVAYEACRVPQSMDNPLYDHGKHCSLWVSAFETLAHTGGDSGIKQVLELIGMRALSDSRLTRKTRMKLERKRGQKPRNKSPKLSATQRIYTHLYRARNAFLHGNRLSIRRFDPHCLADGIRLLDVAPLLFHTALEAHFITPPSKNFTKYNLADELQEEFRNKLLESGYIRALGLWYR